MCLALLSPGREADGFSLGFSSQLLETIPLHTSSHGRLLAWLKEEGLSSRLLQGAPVIALNPLNKQASPQKRRLGGQGVWPLVKIPKAWDVLLFP